MDAEDLKDQNEGEEEEQEVAQEESKYENLSNDPKMKERVKEVF